MVDKRFANLWIAKLELEYAAITLKLVDQTLSKRLEAKKEGFYTEMSLLLNSYEEGAKKAIKNKFPDVDLSFLE